MYATPELQTEVNEAASLHVDRTHRCESPASCCHAHGLTRLEVCKVYSYRAYIHIYIYGAYIVCWVYVHHIYRNL